MDEIIQILKSTRKHNCFFRIKTNKNHSQRIFKLLYAFVSEALKLSFQEKKQCLWLRAEKEKHNGKERERERERISKGGSGKKQGLKYYQYGWDSN